MKLVIDIGNTLVKFAVFLQDEIIFAQNQKTFDASALADVVNSYPDLTSAIISSVRKDDVSFFSHFNDRIRIIRFDDKIKTPLINKYKTPQTLGKDRMAGAVGAYCMHPQDNILIIDAGTSITYDLVTDKREYLGGAISPGIQMRFKALHTLTGKLPLIKPEWENTVNPVGDTTENAILSGVQYAVLCEVDGMIEAYKQRFSELKVLISGGDYKYFDKYLKNNIFAAPNLVLSGLKKILDFNEKD